MILTDKMKDLKIYKTKSYLPYDLKNKKNNSAIYLLSPNFQSSKKLMESQMFINNNRFQSYYLERDVSYYIGGSKVKDIEESTILYEEYIEETKRSELPDDAFGVPSKRKFPLDTEKHVRSAIKFFNYVDPEDEAELARRIIAAMKKFNITDVKVGKNNRFSKYYHPTNESYDKDNAIGESMLFNEKDIYYNKDKFDSGEINLCFITGLSGSGKSTMGNKMEKDNKIIEHYDLDDLQIIKDHFTMDNLKEYGDLIYSYFNGPGKRFYITFEELKEKKWGEEQYEDIMFPDFVHYAMNYAASHKDRKFVLEGIWFFCRKGKPWFSPEEFKNYAFYIKGTSMIVSKHRAALRDCRDAKNKWEMIKAYGKNFFTQNWEAYLFDESALKKFRNYFKSRMVDESYIEERTEPPKNPDIEKVFYVKDKNGIDNCCIKLKGNDKSLRGRSELLVIKDNKIFLNTTKAGHCATEDFKYTVPGGGWEKGEKHSRAATRETEEEAKIKTKNVQYVGSYIVEYDEPVKWVKEKFDNPKDWWSGYYIEVFIADYDGKYTKKIADIDKDENMATKGEFYNIEDVYDKLHPVHKQAIDQYRSINESYVQYKSGFEKKSISFNYKAYDINSKEAKPYIESNSFTKKYLDYLSNNTGEVLVDTDNNKLIGYIFVGKSKDAGFISTLEVVKEYRGYGFGTILIKDAINKYNAIDLVVYKDNKVALDMYKKLGFVIIGEDKNGKAWYMKLKSKLSKDDKIIHESYIEEKCKNLKTARKFVTDVQKIAKKYDANFFLVTDGASGYSNGNGGSNPAVKNARNKQIEWEKENGFNPDEDWSKNESFSADKFLSYLPESTFNMGDKVLFFNEDVNDAKLRKLLFSSRIKNRKELLNILEDVKKECPWIKYIYPDIKRYGNKNLFIDLYYYNSIFFQNNDWVNKKGLNLYSEFMWRLLNKSSVTNYTKKTIFIPILDWDKYHDASVWNYRVNINPMSCIYQMMFMGQLHYLKKAFSTNDVIFIANDKYFKINFSTIDTKDLKRLAIKFRLFLIKICKNEEFDPIDIDTTSDNAESPEVIRAKLIDKVEDNTGIDITKQVADSVEKANAIKKAANRKDIIGITNLEKEKFATKQSIENKKTIIDKQLAKQKELINSTKSKLAKAETDTTTDDITEKRKKDLADKITKASEDYDNEEDAMDELDDEETERLLISLKGGDDRIKITPTRSKRMAQLDEDVLNKEINGRKVKDILEDNSDKKEEITTVDVATPNDEWNELKFMNFDKNYNIEKDLIQIFRHFATCSMPLVIRNLKVSDSSTSEDRTMLYDVDYEDYMGKRYNIKLDIPVMEDNRFLLRGNYKSIQTQFFNMPIIKTEIDTCQLISNYNKIFLYRFGSTAGKSSPIVARIIKASNKYKGTKIKFESGYNLKVSNKYQLPIDYIDLSMVYASITTSRYIIYFNQDIIREKYVIEEDKGIPYAYDKKENAILYFDPSYRPFDEILYDILADGDASFVDLFESATRPNVGAYTRASIMSSKIPLAIILGYYVGLRETLTRANIKYKIADKLTKEIRQDMHKDWIRFEDGYVVYDADYNSNLLLNGLKACSTSIYKLSDMDNKAMYLDFLDDFGGRRKADGLENFRDLFVDPMIRESLEYYNFPTDFIDILIYGSMLLADNKYMKHTNTASRRLRRYQLIAAYTYKVMSGAYNEYSIHKHNPNNANFSVKRSAVIDLFLTDNITSDDSCINALRDIETTNAITTKGPSGMNSDRAYSLDKRAYDESMINVLGMSTGFAGNVGITRQTTIDANVTPDGYVMNNEGETENMNDANTLTATEALTPFGSTHDDPMRTAMTFIQTSKHSVRTEDGDPLLVTNGIDEVIPYMTTNKFAYKAKMDGKILEINDRYILIEYKDGTKDIINLQETIEKNSDGGYYVPMKLDASKGLRKGTQIKKDQILAYDKLSFSNSLGESDNLAYNIGKLAKVAIINSDEGFEDSGIISNSMAKKLATRIDVQYECVINKDAKIFFTAKVGDHIEASQPLIIWEDAFDDEDTQDLINSLSSSTISDIGKRKLNSEVTGELKGIKIFRTVELDDLSESVRQFVEDYEAPIKEFAKVVEENGISKSKVPATYTLPPTGKLKKSQEAIYVEFYVEYLDTVGVGEARQLISVY